MTAKHTQGPWHHEPFSINSVRGTTMFRIVNIFKEEIAYIRDLDNSEAIALLIAAAPKLLEALELAEVEMRYDGWGKFDAENIGKNPAYAAVQAAIAAAKGGA